MSQPLEETVKQAIERMRRARKVPLGVISFDMESEELYFSVFDGVDPAEANALLEKLGITAHLTGKTT